MWKKSDALLKPYFSTLIILLFISILFKEESNLNWQLKGMFYGNGDTIKWVPMWFLPHLFLVYCFTYIFFKITSIQEKKAFYRFSILVIFMMIGTRWIGAFWYVKIILFGKEIALPGLPFSLDIILVSSSFFILGVFLRKTVVSFKPNIYILSMTILIFVAVAVLTDAHIDLNSRLYTNPLFATLAAACGIYFILSASFYISKGTTIQNALIAFGQASLFILIFHFPLGHKVYYYLNGLGAHKYELWCAISSFLISITVPILFKSIVSKYDVLSFFYLPLKPNKPDTLGHQKTP